MLRSVLRASALSAVVLLAGWAAPGDVLLAQVPDGLVVEDGQAQEVEAYADSTTWIREDVWVETDFDTDGSGTPDRMHVSITRPAQTADGLRVPVIYESSPYYSGTGSGNLRYFWDTRHELGAEPPPREPMPDAPYRSLRPNMSRSHIATWVPRGFAVVHSAAPGTGLSQGCPTLGGPNEALAPRAVIDWLNGRARAFTEPHGGEEVVADWSTGRVGMTGTSFNGTLALAAATTGVEGLDAIIPVAPNTSYYHYFRSNGLIRSPGGWLGEDIDVLFDYVNSGDPEMRPYCIQTVREDEMMVHMDRLTGDYNDFWAGRDYLYDVGNIQAATLMAHAFNDWNVMPEHGVRIYEALRDRGQVPARMYFHQGGHGGPPPLEMMNRWFTRFLMDVENGVEDEPRAWIVREGDERLEPTAYPDYPHPEARHVSLHPAVGGVTTGGLLDAAPGGQGTETLVDNFSFAGSVLAAAEWTEHRLLYSTAELEEEVHISGTPRLTIRLAADRPQVNLSVWLVSLPWVGSSLITDDLITRGWADPRNHRSLRDGEDLVPGEFREMTFDLQPTDQVIPAGARIGLMLFSTDREFTISPDPGARIEVDLDGTVLELPVVGGVVRE